MNDKHGADEIDVSEAKLRQTAVNYGFELMTNSLNKNNPAMVASIARLLAALKRD